jgi:uncharacterized protein
MIFEGRFLLEAPQQLVWERLNDTRVLQACIPGCESLEEVTENSYLASIRAKVGPLNAKFKSEIVLREINEPLSYLLSIKSKGGAAGMGEGLARVELLGHENSTELNYSVEFKVQGKLAQIGSRLIMNVIQKMSNEFFSQFAAFFPGQNTEQQ